MNNGTRKASQAKLKGNRVHQELKILALRWLKDHVGYEVVEMLRRKAKRKVGV